MRARILLLLTAMLLITQGTWAQWNVTHNDASDKTGWTIDPTSTTAGTTVTVNYSGPHKVKSVTVAKKWRTPVVTAPTASNRTYDGTTQALVTGGSTTGGTLQYSLSSGSGYSTTVPTATNVGSYTVYYRVVGNEAYTDVAEQSVSVTISKATATVTAPTAKSGTFTYSGSAQTLFNTGSTTGGTMKYKLTTTNTKPSSTSDFKTTIDQGTNAATYYLWYYVDGGTNYNSTSVNSTAVSKAIGKAVATLTCSNAAISFSSSEATNSTKTRSASCTGGTISVSGGSNSTIAATYSSGTITLTRKTNSAVSSTTITVGVTPDANHTAPNNVTFSVSATDTGVALSASSKFYVVATDGLCYPAASFPANKTKAGVVVYKSGSNGLVVSLTNLSSKKSWTEIANSSDNPKTLSHTPAVTGYNWVCGTQTQYSNMWGGGNGCSSWTGFNNVITNVGGTALNINTSDDTFWSCTENNSEYEYGKAFWVNGEWITPHKTGKYNVRPCFAF